MSDQQQKSKKWLEFVARYYGDAEFAKQVDADPTAALCKAGLPVPEGKQVNLVKNNDKQVHYVLPAASVSSMSVEELGKVYGGQCDCGNPPGCGYCQQYC